MFFKVKVIDVGNKQMSNVILAAVNTDQEGAQFDTCMCFPTRDAWVFFGIVFEFVKNNNPFDFAVCYKITSITVGKIYTLT